MSGFNFGGTGGTGGGFSFGTPKTTANAPTGGFSFAPSGTAGGISFGTPTQNATTAQPASLFSMATPAAAAPTPGFSFSTPATTTPASTGGGGFSFGTNTPKLNLGGTNASQPTAPLGGFGLSTNAAPSTMQASQTTAPTGFSFGAPATTTQPAAPPAATGGFSFSNAMSGNPSGFGMNATSTAAQPATATGLPFGVPTPASTGVSSAQPAATFSLGGQSTGFGMQPSAVLQGAAAPSGALPAYPGQGPGLTFGAKPSAATPASTMATASTTAPATALSSLLASSGPSLFSSIASSTAAPTATVGPSSTSTGLSLGTTSTGLGIATTGIGFGYKPLGTTTTATTAAVSTTSTSGIPSTGFTLGLKPLTSMGMSSTVGAATTTTTISNVASTPPVMTYAQLESLINKWSLELEDQEKHFLHQATQVNAWDRTLIENGEKITTLHREVEKVKLDQKRLDQELDFILSQQKELEDLLTPLEESVKEQSGTIYLQHADEEREKTYKLAENIDAQLKRMAQDLKDIIEHLNTSGGPADTSDPLQQICKILNAHMDSLQWIDQNSALLQRKVEEVTKVCDNRRKDQERSFRIAFD